MGKHLHLQIFAREEDLITIFFLYNIVLQRDENCHYLFGET